MDLALILGGALVIDRVFGEPPLYLHPVAWMGRVIEFWGERVLKWKPFFQFVFGTTMSLITIGLFFVPVFFLMNFLKDWNSLVYIIVGMMLFKITFSLRELQKAANKIKMLLLDKNLYEARFHLRALVKRDAQKLTQPLIISATVESVSENTSDSFIAPLFYFLILGVPGAIAYRVINTLDAMIGRHGQYEYLGKFSASLDDVANFIPARLTALLTVLAAFISGKNARTAWQVMARDHSRTASPNAGWPMSAAAGALRVQLTKIDHYELGEAEQPLIPKTIDSALQLMFTTAYTWSIFCLALEVTRYAFATQA